MGGGLESKARAPCLASAASRDRPMARRIGRQRSGAGRTASRAGSFVCFVRAFAPSPTQGEGTVSSKKASPWGVPWVVWEDGFDDGGAGE